MDSSEKRSSPPRTLPALRGSIPESPRQRSQRWSSLHLYPAQRGRIALNDYIRNVFIFHGDDW
jgi:hypothetical protein